MPSRVRSVRGDWSKWLAAAEVAGLSPNAWATRALDRVADLEAAIRREEERNGTSHQPGSRPAEASEAAVLDSSKAEA